MSYYLNLKSISIMAYKDMLKTDILIPSWMILRENIDDNFDVLINQGLSNMALLKDAVKTKKKIQSLSDKTKIDFDYLNILRRQINSYHSPARKICDYPTISDKSKEILEAIGIIASDKLYDFMQISDNFKALKNSIDEKELTHITSLMDVSRLRYVSALYATTQVHSGCDSIEKIAESDPKELFDRIMQVNKENNFYKGNLGPTDIKFLIQDAKLFVKYK